MSDLPLISVTFFSSKREQTNNEWSEDNPRTGNERVMIFKIKMLKENYTKHSILEKPYINFYLAVQST